MVEGRQRDEWDRWSGWMWLFANANIDPNKTPPFPIDAFSPFRELKPIEKLGKTESVKEISVALGARKE